MFDEELEQFKTRIDLREYAAALGYELDRRESSRHASTLRDQAGDKVIVKRDRDGHMVYFSVRDDHDNGTIIDFVARRKGLSLGHVRKELRPWIARPAAALPLFMPLQPVPRDRAAVERVYSRMALATRHAYLEKERHLSPALLVSLRFFGRVRVDEHGNAVFPHFDGDGLCGFEKKNRGFTGFSTGGVKGLWESHDRPDDLCLVVAESAIDALSHAALFPNDRTRYRSIGGQVNDQQPGLIRMAVLDLPIGAQVIAATDNDEAGHVLASMIGKAVRSGGREDLTFTVAHPAPQKDWNEVLQQKALAYPLLPGSLPV